MSLLILGVGSAACASDGGRFSGIGSGITYALNQEPMNADRPDSRRMSGTPAVADAAPRTAAPAPRRKLVGFDRVGGVDTVARVGSTGSGDTLRTASGGSAPLPPDLYAMPKPLGDPQSDRPSPMIAARDIGAVVGFSYKIKPQ